MLYNVFVIFKCVLLNAIGRIHMATEDKKTLTIFVGYDIESDYKELFSSKPISLVAQPKNAVYLDTYEQLDRLLSPAKIDLFRYLVEVQSKEKPKSISQIAKALGRHQEAISRDIGQLTKLGLVALKRFKQTAYALPLYSGIDIKVC